MSTINIGIVHPGEMGVTVAAAATGRACVRWATDGRSRDTRRRADAVGLQSVASLQALTDCSEIIVSVCPPQVAAEIARDVCALGFTGVYVDANAIAPERAREIAERVSRVGGAFVDGSLIGPPARRAGTTRLYLSGASANEVARVFEGSVLEARVIDRHIGSASALKMAYAAWTKGTDALLLAIRALAQDANVTQNLLDEWSLSQPELAERSRGAVGGSVPKAWRFGAEMHEIADTFEAAGLPSGFHRAAADLYARLSTFKDRFEPPPNLDEVVSTLLGEGREQP